MRLPARHDRRHGVRRVSLFYETKPVGGPSGQGNFLNAVAELTTCRSPEGLLEFLLSVEVALGRVRRRERWGPRIIDLDLLLFGERIVDEPSLRVPHPRMIERRFVLEPLHDLAPSLVHPSSGKTIAELLRGLDA